MNPVPSPCSVSAEPSIELTVTKLDTRVTAGEINCTISGTVLVIIEVLSGKGSCLADGAKDFGAEPEFVVGVRIGFVGFEVSKA